VKANSSDEISRAARAALRIDRGILIMHKRTSRFGVLLTGTLVCSSLVRADDSEIFFGQSSSESAANIMFILDTSGSMNNKITTRAEYDPSHTYSGSCSSSYIYQARADLNPPACSTGTAQIPVSQFKCDAAATALGNTGPGWYLDDAIRWATTTTTSEVCTGKGKNRTCSNVTTTTYSWGTAFVGSSSISMSDVECYGDHETAPYPNYSPSSTATQMTNTLADSYWQRGGTRQGRKFYSANYLNWLYDPSQVTSRSRIDIMKEAARSVLTAVSGVKVGLMRYSADADGGMVTQAIAPLTDVGRTNLINTLNGYQPTGGTPLTETLWEAYRYFSGGAVDYGLDSVACLSTSVDLSGSNGNCVDREIDGNTDPDYVAMHSADASMVDPNASTKMYRSPMQYSCQKNFVVYLTDGLPTSDTNANSTSRILGLQNFSSRVPSGCTNSSADGGCLAALTSYMNKTDLRNGNAVEEGYNVVTNFIGFGDDVNSGTAFQYLQGAAQAGGGNAYAAGDLDSLVTVLTKLVQEARSINTTFTAASVAVNAFNRTQTLNDLYVSVFQPSATRRWPGNMKKYRIKDGEIVDVAGNAAVSDSTGFFADGTRSYWSQVNDGQKVSEGGAASRLPDPDSRNVYTYLDTSNKPGSPVALSTGHDFDATNVTATHLNLGAAGDPTAEDLIAWIRGEDIKNEYADRDVRLSMGDPIHAAPAVVIYGGTTNDPDINDAVIYVPTNDGMLHAFAPIAAAQAANESVEELWAFIPKEVLPSLKTLYRNEQTSTRQYLLDGEVRVLKYDINGDGIVDRAAGDKVLLFFGQGRGGQRYYAMDVTIKDEPKFLWSLGPDDLPALGYAWSTPTIARVNINGRTQNSQKLVLVLGGGYDPIEDDNVYHGSDTMGNAIFMVDALIGNTVWSAGKNVTGRSYDLDLQDMDHAIPSPVTVLDTNSDGYADRMYVGDMSARIWRFDIRSSDNAATTTITENDPAHAVTGGVIASFGAHDIAQPADKTEVRRFYNAIDVTAVQQAGTLPYFALSVGSGYRGHPLRSDAAERFYVLRDNKPFTMMSQDDYDNQAIALDSLMTDITSSVTPTIPSDSPGWKLTFSNVGEKVLSTAVTFRNQVFFTTYSPPDGSSTNVCNIGVGKNRAYALKIVDGSPISNLDGTAGITTSDRSVVLQQGGIAPSVSILFPSPDSPDDGESGGDDGSGTGNGEPCTGLNCPSEPEPEQQGTICLSGVEVLGTCNNFNSRVKTYWRDTTN
jgi:type IV pilus assembly protein PilY1